MHSWRYADRIPPFSSPHARSSPPGSMGIPPGRTGIRRNSRECGPIPPLPGRPVREKAREAAGSRWQPPARPVALRKAQSGQDLGWRRDGGTETGNGSEGRKGRTRIRPFAVSSFRHLARISPTHPESRTCPGFTAVWQRRKGRRGFAFILRTLCLIAPLRQKRV